MPCFYVRKDLRRRKPREVRPTRLVEQRDRGRESAYFAQQDVERQVRTNVALGKRSEPRNETRDLVARNLEQLWRAPVRKRRVLSIVELQDDVDPDQRRDRDVRVGREALDAARSGATHEQRMRPIHTRGDELGQGIILRGAAIWLALGQCIIFVPPLRHDGWRGILLPQTLDVPHGALNFLLNTRPDPHALQCRNRRGDRERVGVLPHQRVAPHLTAAQRRLAAVRETSDNRLQQLDRFTAELPELQLQFNARLPDAALDSAHDLLHDVAAKDVGHCICLAVRVRQETVRLLLHVNRYPVVDPDQREESAVLEPALLLEARENARDLEAAAFLVHQHAEAIRRLLRRCLERVCP